MKLSRHAAQKFSLLLSMVFAMNSSSAVSITAAAPEDNASQTGYAGIITKASAYLAAKVNDDSSIGESSIINDTVYALTACKAAGVGGYEASEKWLREKANGRNTDITARIAAVTGDSSYLGKLETKQESDGGFGLYPEYKSDVIDTVLILDAVNETGYSGDNINKDGLLTYLRNSVNTDGGYSWAACNKSEPMLTSLAVYDIAKYCRANSLSIEPFNTSVSFVEKITDSYEDSGIQNTICKYLALEAAGKEPDITGVITELENAQKADGSFAESIETTYYAVMLAKAAVGSASSENVTVTSSTVTTTSMTISSEAVKTETTASEEITTVSSDTTTTDTTVTAVVSTTAGTGENKGLLLGDVNADGIIDGRDATDVLTAYARSSTGKDTSFNDEQKTAADVNVDKMIDGKDATIILTYYAYISTKDDITLEEFIKNQ